MKLSCYECGTASTAQNLVDVYQNVRGEIVVCDDCIHKSVQREHGAVTTARPEGYYHLQIGTFD